MTAHVQKSCKSLLGIAAILAWGVIEVVPVVRADDPPELSTTVEEEKGPPPQESDVQERGTQRAPIQGLQPSVSAPLRLVGPTENLTAVANALSLKHKGLTTVITSAPGLPLTQPVEISIAYISSAGTNRITQPYMKKFGNRIVYNDPEGEGTPRRLRMDIWLTEPKPGGGLYTFSISWQADLDPIYDITVSPLAFELRSNCDYIGNSEIRFGWANPDAVSPSGRNRYHFTTTKGKTVWIQQFGWTRTELTTTAIASMNLHLPAILWTEHDPNPGVPFEGLFHFSVVKLPGKTQHFDFGLFPDQPYPGPDQIRGNTCIARIQYRIIYNLRSYTNL